MMLTASRYGIAFWIRKFLKAAWRSYPTAWRRTAISLLVSALVATCVDATAMASDIGNCLMCHKYPGLSRIGEDGELKLLFINEQTFNNSVHAKVKCEGCHPDIKKIPHDPAKKVDCLAQCHIKEPTSEEKFSHQDVARFLSQSVHAKVDKNQKPKMYAEDMPYCKDCHDNPLYRPLSFFKRVRPGVSEMALGRCRVCHKKDDFIFRFYNHVTTRLHKIRNPINISQMCGRCHDDKALAARHKLATRASHSYSQTFHGKAAYFLDERIPDCLDCHVNPGRSVHQMLSHKDRNSITHENLKGDICARVECHPNASREMAKYQVHAEFNRARNPKHYYFSLAFIVLTGGTLLPLMGIMFLDILRRIFPNATLRRNRFRDE